MFYICNTLNPICITKVTQLVMSMREVASMVVNVSMGERVSMRERVGCIWETASSILSDKPEDKISLKIYFIIKYWRHDDIIQINIGEIDKILLDMTNQTSHPFVPFLDTGMGHLWDIW